MQLIFVFTVVLVQICLINLLEVMEIVRALGVHAFMNDEMLSVLLASQCVGTIRTLEGKAFGKTVLIRREEGCTDLAHQLTGLSVVTVQIRLGSLADGTGAILRDVAFRPTLNRFDRLAVFPSIVVVEVFPVPFLVMVDNLRQLIHLELLVLWGVGIIKGPLFERDVLTDKVYQPDILLI
jgi:hypothetical protein